VCREIGDCAPRTCALLRVRSWCAPAIRYILSCVSAQLSPDEIRVAAETHRELGPEYQDAVIDSFLERVSQEIDARVDARLAAAQTSATQPQAPSRNLALPITSMALGVPLSGITLGLASGDELIGLAIVWIAIAVINVAYALSFRSSRR
jgi:hypothetical protein